MIIREKVSRKQQIEEKATALFEEKGYIGSSMRDLARDLGIEAASLYSHIRSKEELLQNVCFRLADEFMEGIADLDSYSTARDKLYAFITAHVEVVTRDPKASAVFFSEWKHLTEPNLSRFLTMKDNYEKQFQQIIEEGIKSGEFSVIDTKMATLTILSSLNWIYHWYQPKGKLTARQIGEQLAERMIYGIKK